MRRYQATILELLHHYPASRVNFLAAVATGSYQERRKELGRLAEKGLVRVHSPSGGLNPAHGYSEKWKRLYSLTKDHKRFSWHQSKVSDNGLSLLLGAQQNNLPFEFRREVLAGKPSSLPCSITADFKRKTETYDGDFHADDVVKIGTEYLIVETCRYSEQNDAPTFKNKKSYKRALLQIAHILEHRNAQKVWDIPHIKFLLIFDSEEKMRNVMRFMDEELAISSLSTLFTFQPPTEKSPEPYPDIVTRPLLRVGHAPWTISTHAQEVSLGHATTESPDRAA